MFAATEDEEGSSCDSSAISAGAAQEDARMEKYLQRTEFAGDAPDLEFLSSSAGLGLRSTARLDTAVGLHSTARFRTDTGSSVAGLRSTTKLGSAANKIELTDGKGEEEGFMESGKGKQGLFDDDESEMREAGALPRRASWLARRENRQGAFICAPPTATKGSKCVLFHLANCRHLHITGVRFHASRKCTGVRMEASADVIFTKCSFEGGLVPFDAPEVSQHEVQYWVKRVNHVDDESSRENCVVRTKRCVDQFKFPPWVQYIGFSICACFFCGSIMLCLFITAGFTDDEVTEWTVRTLVLLTLDVVLQPFIIAVQFTFQHRRGRGRWGR